LTTDTGWRRPFDGPIPLPRGRELVTLEDAGNYITKLPKAEHEAPVMTFTWKGYGDPRCGCRMGNLAGAEPCSGGLAVQRLYDPPFRGAVKRQAAL
jgi:hypothetical protein